MLHPLDHWSITFSIRTNFLNHLDEWKIEMEKLAQDKSKDKVEELASELDLRLHLHEPRSKRIEMDVRNVRAGLTFFECSWAIWMSYISPHSFEVLARFSSCFFGERKKLNQCFAK